MAARPSSSREPSLLSVDSLSRRSSIGSNPDIFSDDYALEPIDSNLDLSLMDSHDTTPTLTNSTNITPYPAIPHRLSVQGRPSSTTKRHSTNDSVVSLRDQGLERTSSTSSQASRVRPQSPYRGSTRPSHPYGMYPQITRAASIASQSTIRPQERPFVHTGGPEHPYALYSQNTVEDDAEDIGTQPIPLGFPTLGFGSSSGQSSTDVGDIVLSDGHIEQLPPYTRYADNVVAKGDMAEINEPHVVEMDATTSEQSSLMNNHQASSLSTTLVSDESSETGSKRLNWKVKWQQTAHKRVCGGIALWLLITIVSLVIFAGLLGGVVGGVVGRRQGAQGVQKTIWLDAGPTTTNSSIPTCPTGRYSIPFNRTQEIDTCLSNPYFDVTWGCFDMAFLGMTIGRAENGTPTVQFDDYSVSPSSFLYGPQPPDFNGSVISLDPYVDKDNQDLGVAMFFVSEINKLTILPAEAIHPLRKRSIDAREVRARGSQRDQQPLQVGDLPWYCFWNNTISEFWIFLERGPNGSVLDSNATSTASTDSISMTTGQPPASATSPTTTWSAMSASATSDYGRQKGYAAHPWYGNESPYRSDAEPSAYPQGSPRMEKRTYTQQYLPMYPRLIKMVEKRYAENNVQPYCQQMRVLNDFVIVPQEDGPTIMIEEVNFATDNQASGPSKRDTTQQLKSNCVCEWMSI